MQMPKSALMSVLFLAVLATVVAPGTAFAALRVAPGGNALLGKQKMIHLNLRNHSGAPVELRVGDRIMTLENGKTAEMKLPAGTRIVTATKTPTREAGDLICDVTSAIDDTTVVLN